MSAFFGDKFKYMFRIFLLPLAVIAIGATAADAGMMFGSDGSIETTSTPSMKVVVELAQADDDTIDRSDAECGGQTFSCTALNTNGWITCPLALCEGIAPRERLRPTGYLATSNHVPPASPVLESLLKPA